MPLEKEPFQRYNEQKSRDQIVLNLNADERKVIDWAKGILEQPKDATTVKQLLTIGAKTLGNDHTRYIVETLFKNKRKNKRLGIVEF